VVADGETVAVQTALAVLGDDKEEADGSLIADLMAEKAKLSKEIEYIHTHDSQLTAVTSNDILSSLNQGGGQVEFKSGKTIPLSRLQKLLGDRMLQSKRQIPCFYLTIKVDVTNVAEMIEKTNSEGGVEVSIDDFVMLATAVCLERYPEMTGQLGEDTIILSEDNNVGLVMEVAGGAVAPVIKRADKKTIHEIAAERAVFAEKASKGKFSMGDLEGACISISNMGPCGVEMFIPVVIPGQCSIIGVGKMTDTCVPIKKQVEIRKIMKMSISVDHRVANGANAAQFLDYIKKTLETASNFA
jgi:pyruvate dehydrogenase E2 component (dihydrolipoamide acetyltransferase)